MGNESVQKHYQARVVRERQRIKEFILRTSLETQKAWEQTNTTRRILVGEDTELIAWDFPTKQVLYGIAVLRGEFSFEEGPTVTVVKTVPGPRVVTHTLEVGCDPVNLGGDVFVMLDSVEPFVRGDNDQAEVSLIVYSGAGPRGIWKAGTAVGTKEELNQNK